MSTLCDDLERLRDAMLGELNDLHDDYVHTRTLWRLLQVRLSRARSEAVFRNPMTGSELGQAEMTGRAASSLRRLNERTFKEMLALFERFAIGAMRLWLADRPTLIERKAVDVATLLRSQSLEEARRAAIAEAIDSTLRDKTYGTPRKLVGYFDKLIGSRPVSPGDLARLVEMKATRDILEHAGGVVTQEYVTKSGRRARFGSGDLVEVSEAYHAEAFHLVRQLIESYSAAATKAAGLTPRTPAPTAGGA